jgi:hypothetical protein
VRALAASQGPEKTGRDFPLLLKGLTYQKLTDYPYPGQEDNDKFGQPRVKTSDVRAGFASPWSRRVTENSPKIIVKNITKEKNLMLSQIPIDLKQVSPANLDKEILRAAIIAELDAVSLYEQLASMTQNDHLKKVLLDIAKEEKTHVGEFQTLLLRLDTEQKEELAHGEEEVEELVGK